MRTKQGRKAPETEIGTAVLAKPINSEALDAKFDQGTQVRISKSMRSPTGKAYYKLLGTKCWVNDDEVTQVSLGAQPPRQVRYKSVYSVGA